MEGTSIIQSLLEVMFPKEIARHFKIRKVKESKTDITIRMEELSELIPKNYTNLTKK